MSQRIDVSDPTTKAAAEAQVAKAAEDTNNTSATANRVPGKGWVVTTVTKE